MENNDYYESIIKTTRNDKQFKEDLLNVCGNFAKTSLDCIEKQHSELEQLQQEKQQLIYFLEDKIKEYDELMRIFEKNGNNNELEFYKKETYQEILDFVNKGGKE